MKNLVTKNKLKNKIMSTKIKNAKKAIKKFPNVDNLKTLQSLYSKFKSSISKNKAARTISRFKKYINNLEKNNADTINKTE